MYDGSRSRLLWALAPWITVLNASLVKGFSFSFGKMTSCDNLSVQWSGGSAPFTIEYVPLLGSPRHVKVDDSAFSNGKGSFQAQLPFPKDQKMLISMSDSTGYGTGGWSTVQTVGASTGGSCNTTDPGVQFTYELNSALQQCGNYTFSDYDGATQPITIRAIVPGGQMQTINPPQSSNNSYDWIVDVAADTSLVFTMVDSQNKEGGASSMYQVVATGGADNSCLKSNSPTSTSNAPGATSSNGSGSGSSGTKFSTGAIAGTAVGGLIALAVLVTLGLFCLRKHTDKRKGGWTGNKHWGPRPSIDMDDDPSHHAAHPQFPTTPHSGTALSYEPFRDDAQYQPNPFTTPAPSTPSTQMGFADPSSVSGHSRQPSGSNSVSASTSMNSRLTPSQRKAQQAAQERTSSYSQPARVVQHADIEEMAPNEHGVLELPPSYSDRRRPMEDMSSSHSSAQSPGPQSVYSDSHTPGPSAAQSQHSMSPDPRQNANFDPYGGFSR